MNNESKHKVQVDDGKVDTDRVFEFTDHDVAKIHLHDHKSIHKIWVACQKWVDVDLRYYGPKNVPKEHKYDLHAEVFAVVYPRIVDGDYKTKEEVKGAIKKHTSCHRKEYQRNRIRFTEIKPEFLHDLKNKFEDRYELESIHHLVRKIANHMVVALRKIHPHHKKTLESYYIHHIGDLKGTKTALQEFRRALGRHLHVEYALAPTFPVEEKEIIGIAIDMLESGSLHKLLKHFNAEIAQQYIKKEDGENA